MNAKLLIYIVSYQRKEYTQGNVMSITQILPENSQIIVCDNGSTDGTREWLKENQEKYNLGLLFPEENLRVGGAWTLLTNYFEPEDFDYVLLLDNDHWMVPHNKNWFKECLEIFKLDSRITSLGLMDELERGWFSMGLNFDPNYNNKQKLKHTDREIYNTIYYAGCRLEKFKNWHPTMKNWPHKFIGDKIGNHYKSLGLKTVKITPGYAKDISEYDFDNMNHEEYNKWFFKKEKGGIVGEGNAYNRKMGKMPSKEQCKEVIISNFSQGIYNLLCQ